MIIPIFQCLVLPPKGLLHPVLPTRVGGKLLFHLCRSCAETHNPEVCKHTDEDRQFWGVWATCELYKAMEKGYKFVVFVSSRVHIFLSICFLGYSLDLLSES